MSKHKPIYEPDDIAYDPEDMSIAIVASRFNQPYVDALIDQVQSTLKEAGVPDEGLQLIRVPGANELPYVVNLLAEQGACDVVIALGCVIAGETIHDEVIAHTTAQAFQRIGIDTLIPVVNGVITVENEEQAKARCLGEHARGREFASAALAMYELREDLGAESVMDSLMAELGEDWDDDDNPFKSN